MKKLFLVQTLFAMIIFGYGQTIPESVNDKNCCGFKKRLGQLNKQVTNLYFDEQGRPLQPIGFVPFGSQINVIAKNVNPLKTLPTSTLTFSLFNTTRQSDVPDISKMLGISKETEPGNETEKKLPQTKETIASKIESARIVSSKVKDFSRTFDAVSFDLNLSNLTAANVNLDRAMESKDAFRIEEANIELLKQIAALKREILDKEEQIERTNKELKGVKAEVEKKRQESKELLEKLENSLAKIEDLQKQVKRLQDQEAWAKELKTAYNKFVADLHDVAYYFSLGLSVNKLFSEQFLDRATTKELLQQAVITHLPNASPEAKEWLPDSHKFLAAKMNGLMEQYGVVADNFRRINEPPFKDSFGTVNATTISVKNKDGKAATVKIPQLHVTIDREPLYKEQMEYVSSKIAIFRNEKTRDSMLVYSDTLMIRIQKLMNDTFEQPIKTFQANADEITVKLPYGTAEPYKFKTYCHFKVEGSTGLFVHALNTGDKYKTIKVAEDSLQVIRQRKDNILYSFGFLAHFYNYDPRRRFNVGGSIGFNIPISNQANMGFLQGVAGLSFHTTSIEKLSFTVGVSIRKGQRLNTYNLNEQKGKDIYTFKNQNDIEPIYDPIAQVGIFFGLCYSLFGGGKTTASQ